MFHIFSKKKFLIDYLGGFIDIHNHILPGIDDGAKTVADSIDLIKSFLEIGIEKFIATPHIMDNYYPNNYQTINQSLAILKNELIKEGLTQVSIEAAAEHMIDANFEQILDKSEVMPLKKSYLLIEMSYLQPSLNFEDSLEKISAHKLFPILAHPERYHYLHNSSKYEHYKNNGVMFQLNLLSLGDYYGKEVTDCAQNLLSKNLIDFAGTDIHNQRQMEALKKIKISNKIIEQLMPVLERTKYNFN